MNFNINREQLLPTLQQIVNVIEKRQTMPILSNVLLVVEENVLTLTGTDLEIQIIAKVDLEKAEPGGITVPARKFVDIVRLLPAQAEIKIILVDNKLKITSNRSRFTLTTLPANNYPEFSESELENEFSINAGKLKKALDKTLFCMANQDIRYYLNGLLFHLSNSKLNLVASDGHRLSTFEDSIGEGTGYEARIILPRKGILELSRLLDDEEIELKIEFSNSNIRVRINNLVFFAKLVDSKYPDFSKIFDQTFHNSIHIERHVLKDALTRVAVLANEKFKGVTCQISDGLLVLNSHNPEHDEAEEELLIEYQGDPISISFNSQYLLDAVSNLESELVVLTIASNASCCFVEDPIQQPYKFIVMPMRI